jgi:hypothetical protein
MLCNFLIPCCFFHFSQCLWRKVQADKMTFYYKANSKFQANFKMIVAFGVVSSNRVVFEKENT